MPATSVTMAKESSTATGISALLTVWTVNLCGVVGTRQSCGAPAHGVTDERMKSMMSCVGAPGVNTSATPSSLSSGMSCDGIVPPDGHHHVIGVLLAQQLDDARHQRHVGAGQDREADRVGVLLQHGLDDLLRASGAGRCR